MYLIVLIWCIYILKFLNFFLVEVNNKLHICIHSYIASYCRTSWISIMGSLNMCNTSSFEMIIFASSSEILLASLRTYLNDHFSSLARIYWILLIKIEFDPSSLILLIAITISRLSNGWWHHCIIVFCSISKLSNIPQSSAIAIKLSQEIIIAQDPIPLPITYYSTCSKETRNKVSNTISIKGKTHTWFRLLKDLLRLHHQSFTMDRGILFCPAVGNLNNFLRFY